MVSAGFANVLWREVMGYAGLRAVYVCPLSHSPHSKEAPPSTKCAGWGFLLLWVRCC